MCLEIVPNHSCSVALVGMQYCHILVFVPRAKAQWVSLETRASVAGRACVATPAYREKLAKH